MRGIDWSEMFVPDKPLLEIFLRGSIVYLGLLIMMRVVLKRQSGVVGVADLLVIVLIADASQDAMAANYNSITDGLLLVATILFWSYAIDWLGYHFPLAQRLIHPPPLPLVRDGRVLWRNLRIELITEQELMSQLRQQGIEDLARVKSACMEGDGRISVVPCDGPKSGGPPRRMV